MPVLETDVLIAGGGLAGLTAAIHLSRQGFSVVLLEKEPYPHHKVCGEYISNEVLPYLQWLGINPAAQGAVSISHLEFTDVSGKQLYTRLPLGGFGLSRYAFDDCLRLKALGQGAAVLQEKITAIAVQRTGASVTTASGTTYKAKVILGAFGKRSSLDMQLSRSFIRKKSSWMAVKGHYKGIHPRHTVSLHRFKGGYCGISAVEDDTVNICYLVNTTSFQSYKNIDEHREKVLYRNAALRRMLEQAVPVFDRPLTISQVSFRRKPCIEEGVLMIGDSAGLIHPFCGNGMAMAIHSAKIAAALTAGYLEGKGDKEALEKAYQAQWNQTFRNRLLAGRCLAAVLRNDTAAGILTGALSFLPGFLPALIRKTHGQPVTITEHAAEHTV